MIENSGVNISKCRDKNSTKGTACPETDVIMLEAIIQAERKRNEVCKNEDDINEEEEWFRLRQKHLAAYWSKYRHWVKSRIKKWCSDCYFRLDDSQLDSMYQDFYRYSLGVGENGRLRIEEALRKKRDKGNPFHSCFYFWIKNACRTKDNNYFLEDTYKETKTKLKEIKEKYEKAKRNLSLSEEVKKKYELIINGLEKKLNKCKPKHFWISLDREKPEDEKRSCFEEHELKNMNYFDVIGFRMADTYSGYETESELDDLSHKIILEATALPEESDESSTDKKKYRILKELIENPDLTQNEIALRCCTTQPNVSHHIEELAKKANKILLQYSPGKAKADEIGNTKEAYLKLAGRVNDRLKGKLACKIEVHIKQLLEHRYMTTR